MQVVCNGEIYNAPALSRELEARGHRLRTRSDVEVIAHLYEEDGVDVAAKLDGMFAFALWDAQGAPPRARPRPASASSRSTWRERRRSARLGLGGEVPARRRASSRSSTVQALHDYLTLGYVAGPASIFAGVAQLPPGTC